MKKDWKAPTLEVLDVSLTMKGTKPPKDTPKEEDILGS